MYKTSSVSCPADAPTLGFALLWRAGSLGAVGGRSLGARECEPTGKERSSSRVGRSDDAPRAIKNGLLTARRFGPVEALGCAGNARRVGCGMRAVSW